MSTKPTVTIVDDGDRLWCWGHITTEEFNRLSDYRTKSVRHAWASFVPLDCGYKPWRGITEMVEHEHPVFGLVPVTCCDVRVR